MVNKDHNPQDFQESSSLSI